MAKAPFSLGVTYWPRRTGFHWLLSFDRGATREELEQIAALGFTSVRLMLHWEDIQPSPQRLNSAALRVLEQTLDLVAEQRLRAVVGLFPAVLGGALTTPRWVSYADPLDELRQATRFGTPESATGTEPPVIYEDRYHRNQAHDPFRDAAIRAAQQHQIREVVGYFGSHPALDAWQLGDGLEWVRRPDSADASAAWFAEMSELIEHASRNQRTLGTVSPRGLSSAAGPRPDQLAAACTRLSVAVDMLPAALQAEPTSPQAVLFLHALVESLAETPCEMIGLGLPTASGSATGWTTDVMLGRSVPLYLAHPQQQAEFVGSALEQLARAGAPGVWLAAYADVPRALWNRPPLDRSTRARTLGLVDEEGREKPVAAAVRAFAATLRAAPPEAAPPQEKVAPQKPEATAVSRSFNSLNIDRERYWHQPQQQLRELWQAFKDERR